jgi:hypothetical protein
MNEFPPPRQRGLVVHVIAMLVLSAISLGMFWLLFQTSIGLPFTVELLVALGTFIPLPILAYRAYALTRSNYLLNRDNLRLVWGLRIEEIPLADVEWVRPISAVPGPVSLPLFRLPGGILGVTRHAEIGKIEFLASESESLLLIATARRVFAISPANPSAFTASFQRAIEMGSLARAEAHSQYPSFVIAVAWENLLARYLWLVGAFLNVGLLLWVTIIAPGIARVPIGFTPARIPQTPVPGAQLILLPLLSAFSFVFGWLVGLYFYRRPDQRILALMIWVSSVTSSVFFLLAVFFILITPV